MTSCLEGSGPGHETCRYGASRAEFRGPVGDLNAPFVAVLGGSEAYGKFVPAPFPDLLRDWIGGQVVNLSVMHAGLTLLGDEPVMLDIAARAKVTVVQVMGAQNMSNPYYTVHRRRNDRFIAASARLIALFPDVDFTGFHFTGHLMQTLETVDPWSFDTLMEGLRVTWVRRMRGILSAIPGETLLLWMSERSPDHPSRGSAAAPPAFVDREMLNALEGHHSGLVEVVASPAAVGEKVQARGDCEARRAAQALPGPLFHGEVAEALVPAVRRAQEKRRAGDTDAPPSDDLPLRASR